MRRVSRLLLISSLLFITVSAFAITVVDIAPLTYNILSSTTTITTSATPIPATPMVGRRNIAIRLNSTTDTVYIGNSSVTTVTGFPLDSSCPAITIDVDDSVVVYGIVSAGTADVRCVEVK